MRIFISYRRDGSANVTGRIYDRLVQHFGDEAVFKDVNDIPFGVDFKEHLNDAVSRCAVELVVIGPNWLQADDESGRRLDDPTDFVRIEVEAALDRDIPVVPLLVSGASVPKDDQLPPTMQKLAYRNGAPVRPDPDFHRDMDRLIVGLERYVQPGAEAVASSPKPAASSPQVGDGGSVTASGGQSVSVGRDVGRDAVTAGRDVVIQSQGNGGELVTCRVCNGTGLGEPVPCPDCGDLGYGQARGVFGTNNGCVRCGGTDKMVLNPVASHKGKGNQGTGSIKSPCSTCKGLGQVRL